MGIRYLTDKTDHLGEPPKKAPSILPAALLAFLGAVPAARAPRALRKCALPGCIKNTERDYCCAEHCAEHRRLDREGRTP